jgi:hypothetical protein
MLAHCCVVLRRTHDHPQVSESSGVTVAWLCENPSYIGVAGNSMDWLVQGVQALVGKKLEMPVAVLPGARGIDDEE